MANGGGENLERPAGCNLSPSGESSPLAGGSSVARVDSPQFSQPPMGIMFRRCCACNAALPSLAVPAGDPADGMISHGYCEPCERRAQAEVESYLTAQGLMPLPGGVQ